MQSMHDKYYIHKFGGSSLANTERFKAIRSLLQGRDEIIVVSATKGTTSTLQAILDTAKIQECFLAQLNELYRSHQILISNLLSLHRGRRIAAEINHDILTIKHLLQTVQLMGDYSKEIHELILGYGEQWSAKILAAYLGEFANVIYLDATEVLYINDKNGIIGIDWVRSQESLMQFLLDKSFHQLVITGFIAATFDNKRTILGRNGSDFSAAIFAKLFKAKCLTIWTDVDGILSADPDKVQSAIPIASLSYQEAVELAYFGAKVLHPKTIFPLIEDHIPLYIKNSYNPAAVGTCISKTAGTTLHPVRGLSCIDAIALVNIEGTGMMGVSGITARVFAVLQHHNISVILISQASSEHSICFAIDKNHADRVVRVLKENLQQEISQQYIEKIYADDSCAILAAVGDGMVGSIGVAGKLFSTLAKANVNIRAIAQGSSERNISLIVKNTEINRAIRAIHGGFYLARKTISIGLIGPGLVGSALLKQICLMQQQLKNQQQVNLCVRGIINTKKMLLADTEINLADWSNQFNQVTRAANLQSFIQHILSEDMPHAVIIDCTANRDIAKYYTEFLAKGIHVITPNKHANAGDINLYKQLKSFSQQHYCHYLYEATVCAGLPIITTLQDLIKTGDKIIAIEGVVSGTLSFIFNELAQGKAFSKIVNIAKQYGYTEPDPREDLSGADVARKLVCLAREIGYEVGLEDVKIYDLVPEELKSCAIEEFLIHLSEYDESMLNLTLRAKNENKKLCYVGEINEEGKLKVTIDAFPSTHPFFHLKGTDNMLVFRTQRYQQQPLIIQGPGAGAEVTAAGIFADLLRLISFLA